MMASLPNRAPAPKKWFLTNLGQRLLTAVILLPLVLGLTLIGGWGFTGLVTTLCLIGTLEFYVLAHDRPIQGSALIGLPMALVVLLSFQWREDRLAWLALVTGAAITFGLEMLRHPSNLRRSLIQAGMTLAGVLYVAVPGGFLIGLRGEPNGLLWVTLVFGMTWGTDTFAYIGGRLWGKHPLAPIISPKKTVEGAVVGVLGGTIPATLLLLAANAWTPALVPLIVTAPFAAILGDLMESGLKRVFNVKDSHVRGFDIFPGHGGVLDRIDGLIWVAALTYFTIIIFRIGAL
ncbi:MAG: phosphatidate cytidylyltransferase [Chloroflexota bacterium]|nr:phosphatidate cytidylyltransferase [Chloroflexota bacterium]